MLNTIQDIERYNVTNRLERNGTVGSNVIHLRSTPNQLVGATLTFEPGTARQESHVVTAVSEHQVTLATSLAYLHELDTPAVRLDLINLAQNGDYNQASSSGVGAVSLVVNYVPDWVKVGTYVVIDPYTIECEVRRISNISGTTLTIAALSYTHTAGDPIFYEQSDVINSKWCGAVGDGVTGDRVALQRALAQAKLADSKTMWIPGGVYLIDGFTSGFLLSMNIPNLTIRGDGMGITTLKLPDGWSPTGDIRIIFMYAAYQTVRDLTIDFNETSVYTPVADYYIYGVVTGSYGTGDYTFAYRPYIKNVEVMHLFGYAGGSPTAIGMGIYWLNHNLNGVTLAGDVAGAGSATVALSDMDWIGLGQRLIINDGEASEEEVVVTGISYPNKTITATFAGAHSTGEGVIDYNQGRQYGIIEDCNVHDCPSANAYAIAGCHNVMRNCIARFGGRVYSQHALYEQGGYNTYENCHFESWYGYHFHLYKQTPKMDASGTRVINCVSINPGFQHLHFSGLNNDSAPFNPDYPVNALLSRYVTVIGCTFRNTNGFHSGGLDTNHPIYFSGNVFEDVAPKSGAGIISGNSGSSGSIAINNYFSFINPPQASVSGSCISGFSIAEGNVIVISGLAQAITGISGCQTVKNNHITATGAAHIGIYMLAAKSIVEGNNVVVGTNGYAIAGAPTIGLINNNYFESNSVVWYNSPDFSGGKSGYISGNVFVGILRYGVLDNGYVWRNNKISSLTQSGSSAKAIDFPSGAFRTLVADGGLDAGCLVKLNGILATMLGTSDTVFFGVCPSSTGTGVTAPIFFEVGAVVTVAVDDAWTAGNIGVPSTSAAGKLEDSGSATPPATSWVLFLDTGGSAGDALVMIGKTL